MNKLLVTHHSKDGISSTKELIYRETLSFLMKSFEDSPSITVQSDDEVVRAVQTHKPDIVISDHYLSENTALILRGLGIVILLVGDHSRSSSFSDIRIDPATRETPGVFSGTSYLSSSVLKQIPLSDLPAIYGLTPSEIKEQVDINNAETELLDIANLFTKLKWDSDFFGFPIGYVTCQRLTPSIQNLVKKFIRNENIRLLEYLCDCHDRLSVATAEQHGYSFVDIRVTFDRSLTNIQTLPLPSDVKIRKATQKDISPLKDLATDIYRDSRYYFDGNFNRELVIDFYTGWIEKAVLGTFDDYAYVICQNDNPMGFCTIKEHKLRSARIGLVGMHSALRGSGLGSVLLSQVLENLRATGKDHVEVVTQGRNYAAQRLYQKAGFVTQKTQLWYHKWFH